MLANLVRFLFTLLVARVLFGVLRALGRSSRSSPASSPPPQAKAPKPPRDVIDAEFEDLEGGR